MRVVASAFGDGVDNAAGGAPELGRVDAGVDLELLDYVLRCGVAFTRTAAFFGVVCLVVVRAVHFYVVQNGADGAEGDQAVSGRIQRCSRRQQYQVRPAAAV